MNFSPTPNTYSGFRDGVWRAPPAAMKPGAVVTPDGMAEEAAEKVDSLRPAPKGASDADELTVSLKRYPDTRPSFSASCEAVPYPFPAPAATTGKLL
jgi:hypothetical protein